MLTFLQLQLLSFFSLVGECCLERFTLTGALMHLETVILMMFCLFSVSALHVLNESGKQKTLADTLVGIALVIFVAIIVYHGWRQLTDSRWWRFTLKPKWQKYFNSKDEEHPRVQKDSDASEPQQQCSQRSQVTTTVIELREPVLEFSY